MQTKNSVKLALPTDPPVTTSDRSYKASGFSIKWSVKNDVYGYKN